MGSKILVIDDDFSTLKLIEGILKKELYECELFDSAKRFMEYSKNNSIFEYELIISDICMPELNGMDFIRLLSEEEYLKQIPVLFLTVLKDKESIAAIYNISGAFNIDYLRKPFETIELSCRVKTLINLKKKNDELIKSNHELNDALVKLNQAMTERNYLFTKCYNQKMEIEKKFTNLSEQLKVIQTLIPKIATNDLPILKFVIHIIEDSSDVIDSIVKEVAEREDSFRIITRTIEPLKTAHSNIESIIKFLIYYGIIDKKSIENTDLTKTEFFSIITGLYDMGKISQDKINILVENNKFTMKSEDPDIEIF